MFTLIKNLFDIKDDSFGYSEKEITKVEKKIDIVFPKTLRDYYLQLGKHQALNHTQDNLIALSSLAIEDEFLVFYSENQHVYIWGIKTEDLKNPNPKVYRNDGEEWELDSETLHSFFNAMAFMQALFSFPFHANICSIDVKNENTIKKNYLLVVEDFPAWDVKFYRNKPTEIIVVFKNRSQIDLFVSAKNDNDFEDILNKFNLDWDCLLR